MRKVLTAAMAAVSFAGAVAATTTPAQAQPYRGGYYDRGYDRGYYRHRDNGGTAIAAGVVGLALGAAIAGSNHNNGYYAPRPNYYYGGGPGYYARTCQSDERVWDPYIRRSVIITHRYAC